MACEHHVCSQQCAWSLDNWLRRRLHNPQRLLKDFVREGMIVLDVGCGAGTFTLPMALMAGEKGKVIAADLQAGMLAIVAAKVKAEHRKNIKLHQCAKNSIGVKDKVDFALAFYMVHEVPDRTRFFKELHTIIKPGGKLLIFEPKVHVLKEEFEQTIQIAIKEGFTRGSKARAFFSHGIVLERK